jgi:hypothetical protein
MCQSAVSTNKIGSIKEVEGRFYHDFYFYCALPPRDPDSRYPLTPPRPPLAVAWRDDRRVCVPAAQRVPAVLGSARLSTSIPTPLSPATPLPSTAMLQTAPSILTKRSTFSPLQKS